MHLQNRLEEAVNNYNDINRRVGEAETLLSQLKEQRTQLLGQVQLLQQLIKEEEAVETESDVVENS